MMKKYFLYIICAFCLLASCSDDGRVGGMDPVTGAECSPFIGSVRMKWTAPDSENYYYTLVSYVNAAGKTVNRKVSRYSAGADNVTEILITGFTDTEEYEFTLVAYGTDGSSSVPVSIKGRPEGISGAADYVMESVEISATDAGALLKWTNETAVGVTLYVSYVNGLGITVEEEVDASASGEFPFNDLEFGATEFTVFAGNDADGYRTASKKITVESIVDPRDIINIWYDPSRTVPAFFDCGTVGIDKLEVTDEYSYRLTITPSSHEEHFMVFEPLGTSIRRTDLVLTFQYRSEDRFWFTLMYYPFEWETIAQNYKDKKTVLEAMDQWTTVSYPIQNDIATIPGGWGRSDSHFRMIFKTEVASSQDTPIVYEIRNMKLRPGNR